MRKDTRTNKRNFLALLTVACSLFVLAGCQNPYEMTKQAAGTGYFSLAVNGPGGGRTILPSTTKDNFLAYKLQFVGPSGNELDPLYRTNDDLSAVVLLDAGAWKLTVTAYMDAERTKPAARGELQNINVAPGVTVNGNVALLPLEEGQGTFRWNVGFEKPGRIKSASMTIKAVDDSSEQTFHFISNSGVTITSMNSYLTLAAGCYRVVFNLEGTEDNETAARREILYVYQNMESVFEYIFPDGIFSVVEISNVDVIGAALSGSSHGDSAYDPIYLNLLIDLGVMTQSGSGWQKLLAAIDTAGKYVALDLCDCTMNGTVFNPDSSVSTGKDYIVSLVLPDAAESIPDGDWGNGAFNSFNSLNSVSGANVTAIGNFAFQNWNSSSLTSVNFPAATSIGEWAFSNCSRLQSVNFPAAISIGSGAFSSSGLTSITIPAGVTSIEWGVFAGCTSLTGIIIPASVTSIEGWGAFEGCTSLASVTFASGSRLETIGGGAFQDCTSLTSITIPASVTSIESWAFADCTGLASVIFANGSQLQTFDGAFRNCTSLTNINIPASNPHFLSEGGILYNKAKTKLIAWPSASGSFTLPAGITSIGDNAFNSCNLTGNVVIPAAVTSIGNWAFFECKNITGITIHADVTFIGGGAFQGCTSLTTITINASNPNYVVEGGILYNKAKTELIGHPSASGSFTIPADVTIIGKGAFQSCENLTGITIHTGVTFIGDWAFGGCGITTGDVYIPASVMFVGSGAFGDWTNTIHIQGHANQESADAAWGDGWRTNCNATIVYQ